MLLKYHPVFRISISLEFYQPYLKRVEGKYSKGKLRPGGGMVKHLS